MTTNRAAIYLRLSVDRNGQAESLENHRADCAALAASRGWEVVATYVDRDISGFKEVKRPGFEQLTKDLESGQFKNVIAWDWSRITRHGAGALHRFLEAVERAEGTLLTVHQQLDTSTPMGQAIAGFYAAQAQMESEATSRRVSRHELRLAESGKRHGGGTRPYGQNRDGSLVPSEVVNIRAIGAWVLGGRSLRQIAKQLNEQGTVTATGRPWSSSSVGMLIRQPRLAGVRMHKGQRHPADWPAVFPEEEHNRILTALASPTVEKRHTSDALLTGLVHCGRCEARLSWAPSKINGKTFPRYACPKEHPGANGNGRGCGGLAIGQAKAEEAVWKELTRLLGEARLHPLPAPAGDDPVALQGELDRLAVRLEEWSDAFLSGELDRAEWLKGREKVRGDQEALEARLRVTEARRSGQEGLEALLTPDASQLASWWETASVQDKRAAFRASVARVDVAPAAKNQERVKVTPTFGLLMRLGAVGEERLRDASPEEITAAEREVGAA
jgi:site-specific DNA recombinase